MRGERKSYAAWVTWPDGFRELVIDTLDNLGRLYRNGCDVELEMA